MTPAEKFEKLVDDIAAFFALAEMGRTPHRISLTNFNAAEPFTPDAIEIFGERFPGYQDRPIPGDATLKDVRNFDLSLMVQPNQPGELFSLMRHRRVSTQETRGRLSRALPYTIEVTQAHVMRDSHYSAVRFFLGSGDTKSWTVVGPPEIVGLNRPASSLEHTNLQLSLGVHFVRDWDWRVVLGYVGHPTMSFVTDPVGAAEVFRLRDIPEGKTRRTAMMHWVREHWRQQRKDPNAFTHVREHLRGAERFVWNGLSCQIVPAPFDVRRAEAAKAEKGHV